MEDLREETEVNAKNRTNAIEQVDPSLEPPSKSNMSNSSICPTSSCNESIDTTKDIGCSQRLDSSCNVDGVIQRLDLVKDNKPNSTKKRHWGHLYQLSGDVRSRVLSKEVNDRDTCTAPDQVSSMKVQERLFLGRKSSDSVEIQQENKVNDKISNHVHRSKRIFESCSSFGNLLGQQSYDDASDFKASSSGKTSDAETKPEPSTNKHSSHVVEHSGCISLREWLESRAFKVVTKAEKLKLFRKIVELVDSSHLEGFSLQDLRPSNIVFVTPDIIKYITLSRNHMHDHDDTDAQMEKIWYSCPHEIEGGDLFSSNIYSLGVIFFELLCPFESSEERSPAMLNLSHLILPAKLLSESPNEAAFCFWLLHPKSSCRPTTREILDSEAMHCSDDACLINDVPSCYDFDTDTDIDTDSDLLLQLLNSMEEQKKTCVSSLLESITCLDTDIKEVRRKHLNIVPPLIPTNKDVVDNDMLDLLGGGSFNGSDDILERRSCPSKNIDELRTAYFSMRSKIRDHVVDRADKDVLSDRDSWYRFQIGSEDLNTKGRPIDPGGTFLDDMCMFSRYTRFELCGRLRNDNLLGHRNVVCSLSFDRDEEYIAVTGFSNKIKIFEFNSLLNDSDDIGYSNVEMSNKSKLSCICWNKYFKQHLASTDYDGSVKIWDVSSGEAFIIYNEHQKRTWSVDFSIVDPAKFATGSDDCSVKLWYTNEKKSIATIWNPTNICCVQFSSFSSHMLAFGSADHNIYCYDTRHMKTPWCTLSGHGRTISHVKFMDSETLISASIDNTLKLWDLKKTSSESPSPDACSLTFRGHSNQKNFVGLSVLDGYIACGSETNEVYGYHRSFPVPIACHKFGCVDPVSGLEIDDSYGHFVTSVCWRNKSNMLVSSNSSGTLKALRLV